MFVAGMDSASLDRVTFGLELIDDAIGHPVFFPIEAQKEPESMLFISSVEPNCLWLGQTRALARIKFLANSSSNIREIGTEAIIALWGRQTFVALC